VKQRIRIAEVSAVREVSLTAVVDRNTAEIEQDILQYCLEIEVALIAFPEMTAQGLQLLGLVLVENRMGF